jgi:ribosomal protein S6
MNLEGEPSKLLEIETKIKYNESIIRHLVLAVKNHSEDESVLMAESKNKKSEASESKKEVVQKDADAKEKNDE